MWYRNTKNVLESVVQWLRVDAPNDDGDWKAQMDVVQACLQEMREKSEPVITAAAGTTTRYVYHPVADKLNRAMPVLLSMLTAMQKRDRATALAHGESMLHRL